MFKQETCSHVGEVVVNAWQVVLRFYSVANKVLYSFSFAFSKTHSFKACATLFR